MNEILKLIEERHSSRVPFDRERPIAMADLRQILEAARWAPTAHNMQNFEIVVVDDQELLDKVGNIQSQISEEFLRENYQQLSFSEEGWHPGHHVPAIMERSCQAGGGCA